jgi:hypothetical protein
MASGVHHGRCTAENDAAEGEALQSCLIHNCFQIGDECLGAHLQIASLGKPGSAAIEADQPTSARQPSNQARRQGYTQSSSIWL